MVGHCERGAGPHTFQMPAEMRFQLANAHGIHVQGS